MSDKLPIKPPLMIKPENRITRFFKTAFSVSTTNLLRTRTGELKARKDLHSAEVECSEAYEEALIREEHHKNLDIFVGNESERELAEEDVKHREDMRKIKIREERLERSSSEDLDKMRADVEHEEIQFGFEKRQNRIEKGREEFSSEDDLKVSESPFDKISKLEDEFLILEFRAKQRLSGNALDEEIARARDVKDDKISKIREEEMGRDE